MPKIKKPFIKVAIKSPEPDIHGSHPIIGFNMPVLSPGEILEQPKPEFKVAEEVDNLLNKAPKTKPKPRRRPKRKATAPEQREWNISIWSINGTHGQLGCWKNYFT